jgi:hypothetical protein
VREEQTTVERRLRGLLHGLSELVAGLRERREVLGRRVELREELLQACTYAAWAFLRFACTW